MISIESLYFRNYDPNVYQNDPELDQERKELQMEVAQVQKVDDGTYHPADLLQHDIQFKMLE